MTNTRTLDLINDGFHLYVNGARVTEIDIPSDYVSHNFAPILGTHLLITGDKLVNGMVVVLEDHMFRGNPNDLSPENPDRSKGYVPNEYDRRRIEEGARWALVTDFKIVKNGPDSQLAKFTAIYADGTMRDRTYNVSYKWAVLQEVRMSVICSTCGLVHAEEDNTAKTVADDPEAQPFFDMMDAAADLVGSVLFPNAKSQAERIMSVKESIRQTTGNVFDELRSIIEEADLEFEESSRGQRPGESTAEYLDRLRDEAEAAGEYNREDKPKLRQHNVTPFKMASEAEFEALRSKLMGDSSRQ